jgi:hypothetical protein
MVVHLDKSHKKKEFQCGEPSLDRYLHEQAAQDMRKRVAVCFVIPGEDGCIKGYYTLSGDSVRRDELPEAYRKKFGYDKLPVTLLGRLAVDIRWRGQRIGEMLLIDALFRSLENADSEVGSIAVVTDPLDDRAGGFYSRYGFIRLPGSRRLFLPMGTIRQL